MYYYNAKKIGLMPTAWAGFVRRKSDHIAIAVRDGFMTRAEANEWCRDKIKELGGEDS